MEQTKVYVPLNDVISGKEGFNDLEEAYEIYPEQFDGTVGHIIVKTDWLEQYVKRNYDGELSDWMNEYTTEETEDMIFYATIEGSLLGYGVEGEKEITV